MWQPIETAPKDGTEVLAVSVPGGTGVMLVRWIALQDFITTSDAENYASRGMSESDLECPDWFAADFVHGDRLSPDCYPTHWMPLPEPPKSGGREIVVGLEIFNPNDPEMVRRAMAEREREVWDIFNEWGRSRND